MWGKGGRLHPQLGWLYGLHGVIMRKLVAAI